MNSSNKNAIMKRGKGRQTSSKISKKETAAPDFSHFKRKQQHQEDFYLKKVFLFLETFKRDYKRLALIYNPFIKAELERLRLNKEEIDHLKKKYNQIQVEIANIKRKRWCRYCESEATYLSSMGTFYCSKECEQKQNELDSAMIF